MFNAVAYCVFLPKNALFCSIQEHRLEIDARTGTFQSFESFGQQLLDKNHYASDEVHTKLGDMAEARQNLEKWVFRHSLLVTYLKIILLCEFLKLNTRMRE